MFAIIETGGKQYLVKPGERVRIEKLPSADEDVVFDTVLMTGDEKETQVGTPTLKGVVVHAKVVSEGRGKKLIAYKYRRRKRTRVKKGHRQSYMEVEIISIGAPKKEDKASKILSDLSRAKSKEVEGVKPFAVAKVTEPKTVKAPTEKKEASKKTLASKKAGKSK